ncbi:DMT family transporter [Massilia sp. TS11]|uniref:DMT family transporter n=1 Tax=Massilia sp. TS11 TaxID=2908003 RepID=UPI001EDB9D1D|nr:DMT family transporter [Massilia sp. TS11]MCG2585394.1 DMT family transporter [Massilia sp. TS11]
MAAALWMLLASFLFAAMGVCVKLASALYSTSEIVFYRGLIGVILIPLLVRWRGGSLRTAHPFEHTYRGTVGVISLWLWFFAIASLHLATAVTLNYMAPIWMAVYLLALGWFKAHKKVDPALVVAILASFAGVVLILQPAFSSHQWLGGVAGVASSMISALAYLQIRRLSQLGEPEYRIVFYFALVTVVVGGVSTLFEGGFHRPDLYHAALLFGTGLLATVAQLAMTRAYRLGKVLVVANLAYTGIIFSSLWGLILWGDAFDWHVWLGMAIILLSGVAATFYNSRGTAPSSAPLDNE